MLKNFSELEIKDYQNNPFTTIGDDWLLITAGNIVKWNTMTAAWGGLGVLWRRNVGFVFVRYSRYTYKFMEENDTFSLTFFPTHMRKALSYCGAHSGRDVDKAKETGLTPIELPNGSVSFEEARLIICCRKLYADKLDPALFLDETINDLYPQKDYHHMYIGEIEQMWKR